MNFWKVLVISVVAAQLFGCAHKKPAADDTAMSPAAIQDATLTNEYATGSDGGKILGLASIHFDFDRAVVSQSDRALVAQDAEWIKKHPDLKLQIEGHCDARGSVEYNLALGERRAKAVMNALAEYGIEKKRMSVISYGKERPLAEGDSDEAYAKNRRVNFVPMSMQTTPQTHLTMHN